MLNKEICVPRTIQNKPTDFLMVKYALTSFIIRLSNAYADGLI